MEFGEFCSVMDFQMLEQVRCIVLVWYFLFAQTAYNAFLRRNSAIWTAWELEVNPNSTFSYSIHNNISRISHC